MTKLAKQKIIIVGAGGHGKSLISIAKENRQFKVVGYVDKENKGLICDIEYLGKDTILEEIKNPNVIIGYSYVDNGLLDVRRKKIIEYLTDIRCHFPIMVSKFAHVIPDAIIEAGSYVFNKAFINTNVKIGKFCVINNGALIEHDVTIGNNVQIAPGSIVLGEVSILDDVYIGAGSVIRDGISIASNVVIGMGSVITKNIMEPGVYYGNPAKKIKK